MRRIFVNLGAVLFAVSCGGSQQAPDAPAKTESDAAESPPSSSSDAPERPELTAEQCEAGGGSVVGDIGDGAVHRPGYRCASGAAPTGSIVPPEGGPIAIEGAVCCPK